MEKIFEIYNRYEQYSDFLVKGEIGFIFPIVLGIFFLVKMVILLGNTAVGEEKSGMSLYQIMRIMVVGMFLIVALQPVQKTVLYFNGFMVGMADRLMQKEYVENAFKNGMASDIFSKSNALQETAQRGKFNYELFLNAQWGEGGVYKAKLSDKLKEQINQYEKGELVDVTEISMWQKIKNWFTDADEQSSYLIYANYAAALAPWVYDILCSIILLAVVFLLPFTILFNFLPFGKGSIKNWFKMCIAITASQIAVRIFAFILNTYMDETIKDYWGILEAGTGLVIIVKMFTLDFLFGFKILLTFMIVLTILIILVTPLIAMAIYKSDMIDGMMLMAAGQTITNSMLVAGGVNKALNKANQGMKTAAQAVVNPSSAATSMLGKGSKLKNFI